VVIPTSAVQRGPNGTFVYVAGDDNKAKLNMVTVAKQDETITVIATGLTPPERVITTGFGSLTDGTRITIGSDTGAAPTPTARPRGERRGGGGSARPGASGGGTAKPNQQK
jgi:multidrug efflux system membrane fusion protein